MIGTPMHYTALLFLYLYMWILGGFALIIMYQWMMEGDDDETV
jgi:hypothetical protein